MGVDLTVSLSRPSEPKLNGVDLVVPSKSSAHVVWHRLAQDAHSGD